MFDLWWTTTYPNSSTEGDGPMELLCLHIFQPSQYKELQHVRLGGTFFKSELINGRVSTRRYRTQNSKSPSWELSAHSELP
jgi:hypothetical protein